MSLARDLAGRTMVVTGANAGLGYFAAEQLAARGAHIVIASRSETKAHSAIASLRTHVRALVPPTFVHLDLADLASVSRAASELTTMGPIDAVITNAGVLEGSAAGRTRDGFETMFGTNHLGHFALVALLLPALRASPGSRVVHLGSISHRFYALDLDDPQQQRRFTSFRAYARSKLAVMTFAFELDLRLKAAGLDVRSIVAHPGFAVDQLTPTRRGVTPVEPGGTTLKTVLRTVSQGKDSGAEPIVFAATDDYLRGGEYVGPAGWQQLRGRPRVTAAKDWSRDRATAARLWAISETLTGTSIAL
ncbi:SDR family NAD(P)-dependent oxidoreductase [Agreia sp. COWG]|uniref:SDR family NAD(P)-dependent oxidoreductase n=1 Tax=Agreia sp. COWG TaxID=2773266 RepID=UPI00192943D1|nr:SDR family NAD(P)-dependent oxidoreductase [Agreia sp. COWG]CAD6000915.1 NAD(P)-dependent dehydrogenase, short-chain alcohol dehydrogenase family [Agreia sp. COWG]